MPVLVGGVYLAAQPKLYRTGVIKLVPERGRPLAAQTFDDSGRALRLWLLGRLVSMTLVGILTWIGLWLRSEEHTSELQSLMRISYAVFCLKKKKVDKKH